VLRSQPRSPSAFRKIVLNLDSLLKSESVKTHFEGTHRTISPETTWARMSPFLPSLGITRLANVTGLDRVGIPVYMSCRPNSRSLAVSQGKGLSNISAKVSALMESTEQWHGEFNSCLTRVESYAHLKSGALVCDPDLLPLVERSAFTSSRPIPWAMGTDLLGGRPIWVPYEMVHVNTTVPFVPGSGCFVSGSNGLASGNNLLEAILHGLYELVERDALALWEVATPDRWSYRRVDCTTIDDPGCRWLLAQFENANIAVMIWEIGSDVGLPVFVCIISDRESDSLLRPLPASSGSGCHSDRAVALSRALSEAAQSRLTSIAGSRDDMYRYQYGTTQSEDAIQFYRKLANDAQASVDFISAPTFKSPALAEDLVHLLDCLRRISIEHVVVIDLSYPGLPVSVARVIVPGLEGPTHAKSYRPGPRARSRASWKQ
jgi:YcaO-like protein with predicted kinase domain